jgi:hypothetical protein
MCGDPVARNDFGERRLLIGGAHHADAGKIGDRFKVCWHVTLFCFSRLSSLLMMNAEPRQPV